MTITCTVRQVQMVVMCEQGLHARPAALLTQLSKRYTAHITIECNERMADAKSILSILTLCATCGEVVTVTTDGPDAEDALQAIENLFSENFHEHAAAPPEPVRERRARLHR